MLTTSAQLRLDSRLKEGTMSIGEILFMVAVVVVAALMTALKSKVPAWLGFILMILAGGGVAVGAGVTNNLKAVPLGIAGAIGAILAWASGATSKPATNPDLPGGDDSVRRDDPDTLGGVADRIPMWAWLTIAALVIAGFAIGMVLPEHRA
jgi:hypothetical protein